MERIESQETIPASAQELAAAAMCPAELLASPSQPEEIKETIPDDPELQTPPAKPTVRDALSTTAVSGDAHFNSSQNPNDYAKFMRFGQKKIAKFPNMAKMFKAGGKEKLALFQDWMKTGGNAEMIESQLVMKYSQKHEGMAKQECLTVAQMRTRGFTEYPSQTSN